jgi:serine/threonine-protein kinase
MRASRSSGIFLNPAKPEGEGPASEPIADTALEQKASVPWPTSPGIDKILHYELQTKLGEGGMGVVFKALDVDLNRFVALKFLPPQIDRSSVELERFIQEAKALSALNHPNIATIYAVETAGERQFLSLELIPGGTLKAKLQQTYSAGAVLSMDDVFKYAQQTAEGLAHAHARGIIHRDVKTSNLMLTEEGNVKITDFGVAKLAGSSLSTIPGSLLGTIAYMSPEQAMGVDVDARSDLFSFGVVLFELITGRLPFEAPNDAALLTKVANARAPELKAFRPDVPPELEQIVGKALKKRLEERYGTMADLLADIRAARALRSDQTRQTTRNELRAAVAPERIRWRTGVATFLAAAVLAVGLFWGARELLRLVPAARVSTTKASEKIPAKPANRLAVLPFQIFGEQGSKTLSEDVTTELTKQLIQNEQLTRLVSIVSSTELRKDNLTRLEEVSTKFGANLALSGSVFQDHDDVIVSANLIDTRKNIVLNVTDSTALWDRVPSLCQSLAQNLAKMLLVQVAEAPGPGELYLRGRGYLERYDRIESLENAIAAFDKALSKDQTYVLAHAGRAEASLRKYRLTKDDSSLDHARESVANAFRLNDQLAPVHFAKGLLRVAIGYQDGAIDSFQRSWKIAEGAAALPELANSHDSMNRVDLIAQGADALRELANSYDAMNRLKLAEETYHQAIQVRKGYWLGYKQLGVFYQKHGRVDEALPFFKLVAQLAPDDHTSYTNLGAMYLKLERFPEASAAYQQALTIDPSARVYYNLGTSFYLGHRYPEAIDAYRKAADLNPTDGANWGAVGDACRFVSGMLDCAINAYERAVLLKEEELQIRPGDARLRADIASWSTLSNRRKARLEIRKALQLNPQDPRVQATAATVFEQLDMRDEAIAAVERAITLGYSLVELRNWPPLEKLRLDPRYKRIIATVTKGASVPINNK